MRELPMFPLGTVLFPHMLLPLHVFEPRYRALMHDVLAGDGEFGVTLISRGHEVGGGDLRTDVGTIARVVQADELEDGRWLAIGVGSRRIRVDQWLPDAPYPVATVEDLVDVHDGTEVQPVADAVFPRLRRVLAMRAEFGDDAVPPTFDVSDDAEIACWQAAVLAPLTPFDAQQLLVIERCSDRLLRLDRLLTELGETLELQLREGGRRP